MIEVFNEISEHKGNNPIQAYEYDVGFDIRAGEAGKIYPRVSSSFIYTGLHLRFPPWLSGHIRPRSHQLGWDIITEGTIDPGYTGAIKIKLFNLSWSEPYCFEKGDRIAQLKIEIAPEGFFNVLLQMTWKEFAKQLHSFSLTEVPNMDAWPITRRAGRGFMSSGVE